MDNPDFEILSDQTVEVSDWNNNKILLRMLSYEENKMIRHVLFDSNQQFYTVCSKYLTTLNINNFKYDQSTCLVYDSFLILDVFTNNNPTSIGSQFIYFYENKEKYWPCDCLTNFELK